MAEFNQNMWAPWRMEYIRSLEGEQSGCFLCRYAAEPDRDREHHVIWRTDRCMVLFNRFPYSNGHLLIAPNAHEAEMAGMDDATMLELMQQTRNAQRLLQVVSTPHGFNVGMNFGRCAGAGLPGHLHIHIVPRWEGDTNFMPILGDVRVIPESMDALYERMKKMVASLGLPAVRG